ncbi:hypothetical protein M2318_005284 [Metapseudomonas resinovorans]|uniref:hypothetical protein n=1 Tax=Metapseudomonas resinovorans TaxID=53412 RepID=UPI003D1F4CE9
MNSKQRRQARRAMPKPGERITWKCISGSIKTAVVIGPCGECRVHVRMESGATMNPLVSRLIR